MISKNKILFFFLFTIPLLYCGQNMEFDKATFPNKKDELKEALKKLDLGADLYQQGRAALEEQKKLFIQENRMLPLSLHDFQKAGNQYFKDSKYSLLEAQKFNPNNSELNYMLGFITLFLNHQDSETVVYFETAKNLGSQVDPDLSYWLGWAYHLNSRWDEAIKSYLEYKSTINPKIKNGAAMLEDVNKKIAECNAGKYLSTKPERVFVDNLGVNINTPFPEYGPSISTDEEKIFFTSRRPNSVGGKRDLSDNTYMEDLYYSVKVAGQWQPAKQLSKNVNTEGHDAVAGLSPDGTKLYVFRSTSTDGGDLFESVLFGLDWEPPVRMNKYINTRFHESNVSLSFDGKRLFFVSRKEMGFGDADIYFCDMDVNGEWGPSKNIGPEINTKYPEEGAFMHPDGVTMYFSSKGHGSMGGYDIFKSTMVNGKWQAPVNLGVPINGPDDDVFFVVSGSGNRAYFSSAKPGGAGEYDLYKITFLGPEKEPMLNTQDQLISVQAKPVTAIRTEAETEFVRSAHLTILKGTVKDAKTKKPLEALIELVDNEKNEVLATFKSNSSTGKYLATLPSGKNYGIAVKSPGFLFHSENFLLPASTGYQEFILDLEMQKLEVGNVVVLRNIFFDSDKSSLRPESENELNRLVRLLKDNPGAEIEIASYTDNIGSEDYNLKLSESRSKSVVSFLVQKGINTSKLAAKGYGESRPISSNESEVGRQNNRRTEFKILSK